MAEELKTIETVDMSPFKHMVMTIGELPSSFVESMTYYEALAWLDNYIEKTLIPTINNNAEAVEELQGLYTILHDYVENYFDNLDVQEEIDNKLDEMVEDGTFNTIINQEIFGAINDNLAILNSKKVLLIGDSYLQGYNGTTNVNSWGDYFKQYVGFSNSDYQELYESGAGLVHQGGGGHNFQTLLSSNISSINDKNLITSVIICGGVNDYNENTSDIKSAMSNLITYIKEQMPNAKIYFGFISQYNQNEASGNTIRGKMLNNLYPIWCDCARYGAIYLSGVENIGHDYSLKGTDSTHLSEDGYKAVGLGVAQAWLNGSYNYYKINNNSNTMIPVGGDLSNSSLSFQLTGYILSNMKEITLSGININDIDAFTPASNVIKLTADYAIADFPLFRQVVNYQPLLDIEAKITSSNSAKSGFYTGTLGFTNKGAIQITFDSSVNFEITAIRFYNRTWHIPTLLS